MADAAAKESSMEDILSSIRKIISEDDNIKPTEAMGPSPTESSPGPVIAVESSPETAAVEVVTEPTPAVADGKSLSLADIAANVKAGVLTTPTDISPEPQSEPKIETPAESNEAPAENTGDDGMKLSEIVAKMSAFKDEAEGSTKTSVESEPVAVVEPKPEPTAVPAVVESVPEPEETEEFRTALMSPSSDDAVASSFDRLKRSAMDDLDAKTEAILRPMLREWLDENLPTMVERLVREEIERVSRGL